MQALVLVGGLGTRLRKVVNDRPKPMAVVDNKPFLEYIIINLRKNNIKDIIFATGYMCDFIENYFHNGKEFGVNIVYSRENVSLGTAGAIKNAESYIKNENFFVLNGDTYFDIDYSSMYSSHMSNSSYFTMALRKVLNTKRYGAVEYNNENIITNFIEKGECTDSSYINGGIYLINKGIFEFINSNEKISLEKETIYKVMEKQNLYAFKSENYFIDIGIPEDYIKFCEDVKRSVNYDYKIKSTT